MFRNWPVLVIVLASLAIVAAVVLMIYPPADSANAGSRKLAPPPAPERMDLDPLPSQPPQPPPPTGQNDPWQTNQPPPYDNADPDDPFRGANGLDMLLRGLNSRRLAGVQNRFLFTMLGRVCARAKTCGNSQVEMLCAPVDSVLQGAKPTTCGAGKRCLARIDALGCDALADDDLLSVIAFAQDCMQAIQDC
jgi:hypothetical protein